MKRKYDSKEFRHVFKLLVFRLSRFSFSLCFVLFGFVWIGLVMDRCRIGHIVCFQCGGCTPAPRLYRASPDRKQRKRRYDTR